MEVLSVLENKISELLELIKELRAKNAVLIKENQQLLEQIDSLETIILKDKEELDQEKELTKLVVDGIIKNIDSLKSEQSS